MAKYTRIKKSKNLRYKLISILYLLFISLSVLQIPIVWLRSSPVLQGVFNQIEAEDQSLALVEAAKARLRAVEAEFLSQAGLDSTTQKLMQPESYSFTDRFMISEGQAQILFEALRPLVDTVAGLDPKDPFGMRFQSLFQSDLAQGLASGNAEQWGRWKFEHVPATVARLLLRDLYLKLNLLAGSLRYPSQSTAAGPALVLRYNTEHLRVGDSVYIVRRASDPMELDLSQLDSLSYQAIGQGDSIVFIPLRPGKFSLAYSTGAQKGRFTLAVAPAAFRKAFSHPSLQYFYQGIAFDLPARLFPPRVKLSCSCGVTRVQEEASYSLLPQEQGWCLIQAQDASSGVVVFKDSVFVAELPPPQVIVEAAVDGQISRQSLREQGLNFQFSLPGVGNKLVFGLSEAQLTLHTPDSAFRRSFQGEIRVDTAVLKKLRFIEVERLVVNSEAGSQIVSPALTLNISGNDSP